MLITALYMQRIVFAIEMKEKSRNQAGAGRLGRGIAEPHSIKEA